MSTEREQSEEHGIDPTMGLMRYTDEDAVSAVHLALGAASMCWEDVAAAGVFQSETAAQIGVDLIDHLRRLRLMPDVRTDAESAEAEVARLTRLLEQRTKALTRTIDAKNAAEAKVARVEALHMRRPWTWTKDSMFFGQTEFPDRCNHCRRNWPCDTRAALDGGQP